MEIKSYHRDFLREAKRIESFKTGTMTPNNHGCADLFSPFGISEERKGERRRLRTISHIRCLQDDITAASINIAGSALSWFFRRCFATTELRSHIHPTRVILSLIALYFYGCIWNPPYRSLSAVGIFFLHPVRPPNL